VNRLHAPATTSSDCGSRDAAWEQAPKTRATVVFALLRDTTAVLRVWELGSPMAMNNLAIVSKQTGQTAEAAAWEHRAAEHGFPAAMVREGFRAFREGRMEGGCPPWPTSGMGRTCSARPC
jgi:TPR repeat protein